MPHSSPSFMNTVIQLEDGVSDAPSKSIEVVDELVEIIGQNPYCI